MKTGNHDYVLLLNGEKENLMDFERIAESENLTKAFIHKIQTAVEFIKATDMAAMVIAVNPQEGEKLKHNAKINRMEHEIMTVLYSLGITPQLHGYHYLKEAILTVVQAPKYSVQVTKTLYPDIAKKYGLSDRGVERSMRTAIDVAWKNCARKAKKTYFDDPDKERPTNSEFIATIAEYIREKTIK